MAKQFSQKELKNYVAFVIKARELMSRAMTDHPPDSVERYEVQDALFPRYTDDVTKSPFNRVVAEARRNGELNILFPLLQEVETSFRAFANVFTTYPQTNVCPPETEPLFAAITAITRLFSDPTPVDPKGEEGKAEPEIDELVTLSQVHPLVGLSKRQLERYLAAGKLPRPDRPGGDGKAHKWHWGRLRPALERVSRLHLPETFPGSRIKPPT